MPLQIVRQDITKMAVDAIVNAANETLLGGGGVDGAIHRAAGAGLLSECKALGGCKTGSAKITGGYDLPAKYVIHTVGPVYKDGKSGERELLSSCYRESLRLAKDNGCETVAFPLISSGVYGYPKDAALKVAMDEIGDFLFENDMTVYVVVFDKAAFNISERLFADITEYIDDNYVEEQRENRLERVRRMNALPSTFSLGRCEDRSSKFDGEPPVMCATEEKADDLDGLVIDLDESFSQMLLRKIDERGMTDAQCYKKANVDRKLFSKIRSDTHYRPSKPTAIAFAIALELSIPEAEDLLRKAGFALSHSNKFDIIIEYFIKKGNYNIFEINEALFAFDQSLLGV